MQKKSLAKQRCSTARTIDILGDQWSLMILRDAFYGYSRFSEFQERLGVPKSTLAHRLAHLVSQDILAKERLSETASRFEYRLTDKGKDLFPVIVAIMQWGDRWIFGENRQPVILIDKEEEQPLSNLVVRSASGRELQPRDVSFVAGWGANQSIQSLARQRGHNSPLQKLLNQQTRNT